MTGGESASPQPRVTVITACYDDGATVGETVASCLGQGCEVVLVDDGSTDPHTVEVLDALAGGPVRLVQQENRGLGPARMRALREVRTPYVLALDADDQLLPGALGAMADVLDRDPTLSLVWGDYEVFGDYARVQHTADALDPWQISYLNELPVAALIRRDALAAAGGWQGPTGYEDWNLWMGFAERGLRGVRLPLVTYRYRRHGARMSAGMIERNAHNEAELRRRHPALYTARWTNWRTSRAPLLNRLAFPVIDGFPGLPELARLHLLNLTSAVAHRRLDTLRWIAMRRVPRRRPQRAGRRQSRR